MIVNKSTVPVGTGDMVREIIETNRRRNVDFDVVCNPEFLREGSAIKDTLEPDRIVIGAPNQVVAMKILELYAPLERPMIITDVASAEMIKYASQRVSLPPRSASPTPSPTSATRSARTCCR